MNKKTFDEILKRCEEMINAEYDFPSFASYYITDNECDGTSIKPFKLKTLCTYCLKPYTPNKNGKYELSIDQKIDFIEKVKETFIKENMYMF